MEWKWAKANEKDLAKFINEKALELLPKLSVNRFDSIQNPEGRYVLIEDIYKTLTNLDIRYAFEKYHPEEETQLIRTPSEILSKPGEGTCLDLSLLFCSLCFACDLLPLLIVIKGHALAAVSLNHTRSNDDKEHQWDGYGFPRSLFNTRELFNGEEKLAELRKLVDDGAYVAVECTGFAHTQSFNGSEPEAVGRNANGSLSFRQSTIAGRKQLSNSERPFQFAIDIAAAKYIWKIPTEEIPNFEKAKERAEALFNVKVGQQDGGKVTGVEAEEVTTDRDIITNVIVDKANNVDVAGGRFGKL